MTWVSMLKRNISGKLTCFAEFLEDENRRRVAAFGYHAGYAGKTPRVVTLTLHDLHIGVLSTVCFLSNHPSSALERMSNTDTMPSSGAAIALLDWAHQLEHGAQTPLPGKKPYNTESDLVNEVRSELSRGIQKNRGKAPQVLIIGALGR